jgi:hypothetical protein
MSVSVQGPRAVTGQRALGDDLLPVTSGRNRAPRVETSICYACYQLTDASERCCVAREADAPQNWRYHWTNRIIAAGELVG